jgi:hypothetical protein
MNGNTNALIDSALIHSAIAALILGAHDQSSAWDTGSLLEATYLLMNGSVGMVPGPGPYGGAAGYYGKVISAFPEMEARKFNAETAKRLTKAWLTRYPEKLEQPWKQLQGDTNFHAWSLLQKELFWGAHTEMHTALFNQEYTVPISKILGCSESELQRIHDLSQNIRVVKEWSKKPDSSEAAQLATQSWLLSALIRGKYHEYIARSGSLQLVAHRFRAGVGGKAGAPLTQRVYSSEECLTKAIIGGAFLESNADRRVAAWVENIRKTRIALLARKVALPDSMTQSDAENAAISAARSIGISSSSAYFHRAFDSGMSVVVGTLVAIAVAPWAGHAAPAVGVVATKVTSSAALQVYRHKRGRSAGEDLAKLAFATEGRFRTLIRNVPGRIEREIKLQ